MRLAPSLILLLMVTIRAAQTDQTGFERLKTLLVGDWQFVEDGKSYDAKFEAVSHGQALLERNSGFIAVYHADGSSLMMTLYTRDGNQPRFRASSLTEATQSLRFEFVDVTSWQKGTDHMNGLEIVFKDKNHLVEKWETLHPDGTKTQFAFELVRAHR